MREPREYENPLCAEVGGDLFFAEKENEGKLIRLNIAAAKSICRRCQHTSECAEWAIRKERYGIWGGLTDSDRAAIRRKRNITLGRESSA
jgi:WhiB family redox-sensing transcriptional regulator